MERKVGEVFECNGINLKVVKEKEMCMNCYFHCTSLCKDFAQIRGECQSASRLDGGVIFIKVKDMETRNVRLSLEKAKEFYKKGGEFRDLALSAFAEEELTKKELPKTWDEYCYVYESNNNVGVSITTSTDEQADAYTALSKLHYLRDCYRQGWKPNFNDKSTKYCVKVKGDYVYLYTSMETSCFLSFQTIELAREFMGNFRCLIIKAGDLV